MHKSHKYFNVHDKILHHDACHSSIDLKMKQSILKGKNLSVHVRIDKYNRTCTKGNSQDMEPTLNPHRADFFSPLKARYFVPYVSNFHC